MIKENSKDDKMIEITETPIVETQQSSLFNKIKGGDQKVTSQEKSPRLCLNFLQVFLRTVLRIIIVGITVAVPISLIAMGVTYLNDCKANPLIPVFILIMGVFGIIKQLLNLFTLVRGKENQAEESKRHSPTQILLNCFLLGCLIICSYWIYKEYPPKINPLTDTISCDETFYYFSFWLITTIYIIMSIGFVVLCSATIVFLWIDRKMLTQQTT